MCGCCLFRSLVVTEAEAATTTKPGMVSSKKSQKKTEGKKRVKNGNTLSGTNQTKSKGSQSVGMNDFTSAMAWRNEIKVHGGRKKSRVEYDFVYWPTCCLNQRSSVHGLNHRHGKSGAPFSYWESSSHLLYADIQSQHKVVLASIQMKDGNGGRHSRGISLGLREILRT